VGTLADATGALLTSANAMGKISVIDARGSGTTLVNQAAMLYRTDIAPLGGYFYYDDSAANAQPNAVLLIRREFFPIGTVAFTDATRLLMLDSEHYDLG
jgi:hypothetical protein